VCGADRTLDPQDDLAVYNGRILLGLIARRAHGFDAVTAGGKALGRFNSQHSAARALFEAGVEEKALNHG
jgi:hypothetical protein